MNTELVFLFGKPLMHALAFSCLECPIGMPERRRRNEILDSDLTCLEDNLTENESIELGSAYSILLDHESEAPIVYVKTYGEVDLASVRKEIGKHYPGAKIEGIPSNAPVLTSRKRGPKSKKRNL